MTASDPRDPAQASAAARDKALESRAADLRNHMLGEWAAGLMGLDNPKAYAAAVSRSQAEQPRDEDVHRKVSHDLTDSGLASAAAEVWAKMDEFLAQARARLAGEGPDRGRAG
jgi:hypothetical protein